MNIEDLLREGTKEIPSLVGAKFSSKDLVDLIGCVFLEAPNKNNKKFELLYGCDEVNIIGLFGYCKGGTSWTRN